MDCPDSEGHLERIVRVQTSLLEKVGCVALNYKPGENLDAPCCTGNLSSPQIGPLKAGEVRRVPGHILFESVGLDHERHGLFCIPLCHLLTLGRSQPHNGVLSLVVATLPDEPPWRFGAENSEWENDYRPDPLDGKRNAIGPVALRVFETKENGIGEKLPDSPANHHPSFKITAQDKRGHLRGKGRGHGRKHAPRDASQELTNKENSNIWGKNLNENESGED